MRVSIYDPAQSWEFRSSGRKEQAVAKPEVLSEWQKEFVL